MVWIDLVAGWWDRSLLRTSDMDWPTLQDTVGAGADALRRTAVQAAGDGWPGLDAIVPCTDWVVVLHADRLGFLEVAEDGAQSRDWDCLKVAGEASEEGGVGRLIVGIAGTRTAELLTWRRKPVVTVAAASNRRAPPESDRI